MTQYSVPENAIVVAKLWYIAIHIQTWLVAGHTGEAFVENGNAVVGNGRVVQAVEMPELDEQDVPTRWHRRGGKLRIEESRDTIFKRKQVHL